MIFMLLYSVENKKDGTTFLLLNKDEPNRIELTVNGNNVYLKGQTVIKKKNIIGLFGKNVMIGKEKLI